MGNNGNGVNFPFGANSKRDHKVEWARRKTKVYNQACALRDLMRAALGGKCRECGSKDDLSFHHPGGRTWDIRKQNLMQRMRLYYKDFLQNKLDLLCVPCNSKDGSRNKKWYSEAKHERKVNEKAA